MEAVAWPMAECQMAGRLISSVLQKVAEWSFHWYIPGIYSIHRSSEQVLLVALLSFAQPDRVMKLAYSSLFHNLGRPTHHFQTNRYILSWFTSHDHPGYIPVGSIHFVSPWILKVPSTPQAEANMMESLAQMQKEQAGLDAMKWEEKQKGGQPMNEQSNRTTMQK